MVATQSEIIECGELAESDLVDYLKLKGEMNVPMVLGEDFHISEDDTDKLNEFVRKYFNLELKSYPAVQTTLSGSFVDSTFSRYAHNL